MFCKQIQQGGFIDQIIWGKEHVFTELISIFKLSSSSLKIFYYL